MPMIVYVSCADDKAITVLEMDPVGGDLTERARVPVPGTNEPSTGSMPLALSPDRHFLYAALRTAPFPVSSFRINRSDGSLAHVGMAKLPDSMCYLSTDTSGAFMFSASYGGNKLAVAPIVNGVVQDSTQIVETPPKAHSVQVDPSNRFVYAATLGGDAILCQHFDRATGRIDPVPQIAARTRAGAGPRHLQFARNGAVLYLINELDGSINVYERDVGTGALAEIQSISMLRSPAADRVAAADLHISPDGRFLYGSERTTNILAAFRIEPSSGKLSLIGHVDSETTPRGFAVSPQGRFVLCAGMATGKLGVYAIDPGTGALRHHSAVEVGAAPNWIEIVEL